MKKNNFHFLCMFFLLMPFPWSLSGQITTATVTPNQAVLNIMMGSGILASNVTFNGYSNALGAVYASPSDSLGMTQGVYITSGSIYQTDPNNMGSAGQDGPAGPSTNFQSVDQSIMGGTGLGDADLTGIAGASTFDAASLEFDFIPGGDTLKLDYVMGSEEYNEWVNAGFNDAFGFFLTGVTTTLATTNIALISGTTSIVSIGNVNNGNTAAGVVSSGPCMNCAYFRGNTNGSINCVYDGLTTLLEVRYPVVLGSTYHIKLVVADAGDHVFDTGVFFVAGSLRSMGGISTGTNQVTTKEEEFIFVPKNVVLSGQNIFKVGGKDVSKYVMNIFDSSGRLLTSTSNIGETFDGRTWANGIYYYSISAQSNAGNSVMKNGMINILH